MKKKLFCLPYAGGSAMVYNTWKKHINHSIELYPVELAGRGRRFSEPLYGSFEDAVEDIYRFVIKILDDTEYAIFGHSMGSLLAVELLHKLKQSEYRAPLHAFFSGRYPPHIKKGEDIYTLPDEEFTNEIFRLGGTPKELMESEELLGLFIPILKSDYRILDGYYYNHGSGKFDCSITVFSGKEDPDIDQGDLSQWQAYTDKTCRIHEFQGGHFFINDHYKSIVEIINSTLMCS